MAPTHSFNLAVSSVAVTVTLVAIFGGALTIYGGAGGAIFDLPGCEDNVLPYTDDGSTGAIALPFSPNFFGTTFSSLYVNNNGNITFDNPLFQAQSPALSDLDRPIIAPFFADVDTQGLGSETVKYGATTQDGHEAFCVTWVNVGYYNDHTNGLNSAQLLLIDRSDIAAGDFDIMFNYDTIEWETGDANGGIGGLGGQSARAGYSDGTSFLEIAGSGIAGCFLDTSASGLIHSRLGSDQNGRYVFEARDGALPTIGALPEACQEPLPTVTPTPTGTSTPVAAAGDVDCSELVDSVDALLVLQLVAGMLGTLECDVGDVDGSNSADAVDATLILQYAVGLIDHLPV